MGNTGRWLDEMERWPLHLQVISKTAILLDLIVAPFTLSRVHRGGSGCSCGMVLEPGGGAVWVGWVRVCFRYQRGSESVSLRGLLSKDRSSSLERKQEPGHLGGSPGRVCSIYSGDLGLSPTWVICSMFSPSLSSCFLSVLSNKGENQKKNKENEK